MPNILKKIFQEKHVSSITTGYFIIYKKVSNKFSL
jgi:hypothetical protein